MQYKQHLNELPPEQRISHGEHLEPVWYDGKLFHVFGRIVVIVSAERAGGQTSDVRH